MSETIISTRTLATSKMFYTIKEELNSNKIITENVFCAFAMSSKDKEDI